jgi:hypothetical protein
MGTETGCELPARSISLHAHHCSSGGVWRAEARVQLGAPVVARAWRSRRVILALADNPSAGTGSQSATRSRCGRRAHRFQRHPRRMADIVNWILC